MTRLIVVPLDGSGFAEDALAVAGSLAADTGGWLNLVTVHRPMVPIPDWGLEASFTADAEIQQPSWPILAGRLIEPRQPLASRPRPLCSRGRSRARSRNTSSPARQTWS